MVLLRQLCKLVSLLCVLFTSYLISAEPYRPQLLAVKVANLPIEKRQVPDANEFKSFEGVIRPDTHTFEQAYWVKVIPPKDFDYDSDGLMVINPITLHSVDMYIPELNQNTPIRSISRFDVKVDTRYTRRSSVFELPLNYKNNSPIYFYIETAEPQTLNLEYIHRNEYQEIDNKHNTLYSAIFGGLTILIFINLFIYFSSTVRSYLYYVLYLSTFLFVILMTTGELYQYGFSAYFADTYSKNHLAYYILSITALLFTQSFLRVDQLSTKLYEIFKLLIALFGLVAVVTMLIDVIPPWFMRGAHYLMLLSIIFLVYTAIRSAAKGNPRAFYYLVAFMPLIFTIVFRIFAAMEILPANRFTINGFQIAIVFQALVLSLGLAHDLFINLSELKDTQQISASTSNVLSVEKDFTTFLSRFTDTLTPENFREQDEIIVRSYFERLKKVYGVVSGALVYQGQGEKGFFSDSDETIDQYDRYLNEHRSYLISMCKGEMIENVSKLLSSEDKLYEYYAIPIHNANLTWCGLIIALPHYKKIPNATFNEIHRFTTELVRTFVNLYQLSVSVQFDQLTKTMSRSGILDALERYQNLEPRLTIVLFNISNFKKLNRSFGFQSGDSCLLYLTYLVKKNASEKVKCGRVSSSQFMLIFRNQELTYVQNYVKRVYRELSPVTVDRGVCKIDLQFSIVESYSPHNLAESLLATAEEDLHQPVSTELEELFSHELEARFS